MNQIPAPPMAKIEIATLRKENRWLREAITAAYLQLETASYSTNKGAADLAKFIMTYLPAPPNTKEG